MFAEEAGINTDDNNGTTSSSMKDILEKKWTSLVTMKKKVIELEK
jgi:hypothetical protein